MSVATNSSSVVSTGPVTQYVHTGLSPLTNYTFSVQAYNSMGWSDYSRDATLATDDGTVPDRCEPPQRGDYEGTSRVTSFVLLWSGERLQSHSTFDPTLQLRSHAVGALSSAPRPGLFLCSASLPPSLLPR